MYKTTIVLLYKQCSIFLPDCVTIIMWLSLDIVRALFRHSNCLSPEPKCFNSLLYLLMSRHKMGVLQLVVTRAEASGMGKIYGLG